MKKITPKIVISKISEAIILALLAFITIIPIYWGIVTSLKNKNEIATYPPKVIGFNVTWSNYVRIVGQGYLRALGNSAFYSLVTIILCLILGYIAGYGFERRNFLFKKFWFSLVVIGIPLSTGCSVLLIPNYLMMMKLHMTNHIYTMPIIYATYNLPLCIWMMISGVRSLPVEIEESAKIDGCSQRYIITRLIPPIIKPSFAAAGIFIFIGAWNEYISTSVMINSRELKNVQMAIYDYMGFFGQEWGPLCAAATAAIIPILVVFTILGKQLVSGLTAGAVKG
ncbi:MAG: carbohydrate ABC transporter permease [Lachnospiraceae bacterium]|nr:carbohydrate ABC transporter permease [Lachnospiraceae bacterium]